MKKRKTGRIAEPTTPTQAALPPLTQNIEPYFTLDIEGVGTVLSDAPGGLPICKRLAIAFTDLNEHRESKVGICCSPDKAFVLISFDPVKRTLKARLSEQVEVMGIKALGNVTFSAGQRPTESYRPRHSGLPLPPKPAPIPQSRYSSSRYGS